MYDQANSAYGALGKDAFDAAEEYARYVTKLYLGFLMLSFCIQEEETWNVEVSTDIGKSSRLQEEAKSDGLTSNTK